MTGKEFELIVKDLLQKEVSKSFNEPVLIEHLKTYKTRGGYYYQIDLSYKFRLHGIEYLTIIECKYWNQNVSRDTLNTIHSKLFDLKAHKAIVVSRKGFQKGAIAFAKDHKIALLRVGENSELEYYSNFDGGIDSVEDSLLNDTEDPLPLSNGKINGLVPPSVDLYEFIGNTYGRELAEFLKSGEIENYLDTWGNELPPTIEKQKRALPDDVIGKYQLIESCGLPLKMWNEVELRIASFTLFLLKTL